MDLDMMQEAQAGTSMAGHYDAPAFSHDDQMMMYGASPASTDMMIEGHTMKAAGHDADYEANEVMMREEYVGVEDDAAALQTNIETDGHDFAYESTSQPAEDDHGHDITAEASNGAIADTQEQNEEEGEGLGERESAELRDEDGVPADDDVDPTGTIAISKDVAEQDPSQGHDFVQDVHTQDVAEAESEQTADHVAEENTESEPLRENLEVPSLTGQDDRDDEVHKQVAASDAEVEQAQDGNSQSQTSTLPVLVTFNEQDFVAFASSEESAYIKADDLSTYVTAPGLNIETSIAHESLDTFFEALRVKESLGDFLDEGTELCIFFRDLDLTLREDDVYAREVTLDDVQRIHAGLGLQHTLHLIVTEHRRFITRYNELAHQATTAIEEQFSQGADEGAVQEVSVTEEAEESVVPSSTQRGVDADVDYRNTATTTDVSRVGSLPDAEASGETGQPSGVTAEIGSNTAQTGVQDERDHIPATHTEGEDNEEVDGEEEEEGEDDQRESSIRNKDASDDETESPSSAIAAEDQEDTFVTVANDDDAESFADATSEQDYTPVLDQDEGSEVTDAEADDETENETAEEAQRLEFANGNVEFSGEREAVGQSEDVADVVASYHISNEQAEDLADYEVGGMDQVEDVTSGYDGTAATLEDEEGDSAQHTMSNNKRTHEHEYGSDEVDDVYRTESDVKRTRYDEEDPGSLAE